MGTIAEKPSDSLPEVAVRPSKDASEWLRKESWPTPKWHAEAREPDIVSDTYLADSVRAKYTELKNEFMALLGSRIGRETVDQPTTERIFDLLHQARGILEQQEPDLCTAFNLLDLVQRGMVWLYSPTELMAQIRIMLSRLQAPVASVQIEGQGWFVKQLKALSRQMLAEEPEAAVELRQTFDETIGVYNRWLFSVLDNNDRQIRKVKKLLSKENWPHPKFPTEAKEVHRTPTFEDYLTHQLRSRYIVLESEFRIQLDAKITSGVDTVTAERVFGLLQTAREELEKPKPNPRTVSSTLDLISRYMVWIYGPADLPGQVDLIMARLESYEGAAKARFVERLNESSPKLEEDEISEAIYQEIRTVLDQANGFLNEQTTQEQMSDGLQLERLGRLFRWGLMLLVIFLLGFPFVANTIAFQNWPSSQYITGQPETSSPVVGALEPGSDVPDAQPSPVVTPAVLYPQDGITPQDAGPFCALIIVWISAFAIAMVGGAGGFLSGLLQARSTRVKTPQFLESMLNLQLKPLVGALASLVLCAFLSWQVLPVIQVENVGSYVLAAFLSGFSERYFLRLLKADNAVGGEGQFNQIST